MKLEYENIFDVITNDSERASKLQECSNVMIVIRDIINHNQWNEQQSAAAIGIPRYIISDLKNGLIDKFFMEYKKQ